MHAVLCVSHQRHRQPQNQRCGVVIADFRYGLDSCERFVLTYSHARCTHGTKNSARVVMMFGKCLALYDKGKGKRRFI